MKLLIKSWPQGVQVDEVEVETRAAAIQYAQDFLGRTLNISRPEQRFPGIYQDILLGRQWEMTLEGYVPTLEPGMLVRRVESHRETRYLLKQDAQDEEWWAMVPKNRMQYAHNHLAWIHTHRMMLQICVNGQWFDPHKDERLAFFAKYTEGIVK